IRGRIGDSLVQVGGLVSPSAAQPLTTIVPLDPIWVRFKVSEAEYFEYERRGALDGGAGMPLELIRADGSVHPHPGRIENTGNERQGARAVLPVAPENRVPARSYSRGARVGARWLIRQGLMPGGRVIVGGVHKARPGSVVDPEPYVETQPENGEER